VVLRPGKELLVGDHLGRDRRIDALLTVALPFGDPHGRYLRGLCRLRRGFVSWRWIVTPRRSLSSLCRGLSRGAAAGYSQMRQHLDRGAPIILWSRGAAAWRLH